MWTALVVFIGSFVCLVLLIFSVAVGFTFFVLPIVTAELMLLVAVFLMRRALVSEHAERQPPRPWYARREEEPEPLAWYATPGNSPPSARGQLDERQTRPYRVESRRPGR